ncbi:MAG: hypothetical protein COB67_09625 [SAR324 cluster bacterium]|uniref:Secretion system C-terminal sorting domain-containing protein n=1 Tax=SAR324 cluster bacterium TaxID=2024889 RepID=A0A2A4T0B4_9DELT|nr:MAG: hypothetical protein COB67_09625 [SAR324 cluster bacterium]
MKTILIISFSIFYCSFTNAQALTHDNQNRITSVTYTTGTQITYTYDAVGNRVTQVITSANNGSLPVEITDFNVIKNDCETTLTWSTASEINTSHFEVQYSYDAIDFRMIERVEAAGNSTSIQNYGYVHPDPVKGTNYYRLKSVDLDDTYSYSKMKAINLDDCFMDDIRVFPNPSNQQEVTVEINSISEVVRLEIYDASGRLIGIPIQKTSRRYWKLDVDELSSGAYFIRIIFEGDKKQVITKKLEVVE